MQGNIALEWLLKYRTVEEYLTKKVATGELAAAPRQTQEQQHSYSTDLKRQQQAVIIDSQPHQHVRAGKTHRGDRGYLVHFSTHL